MFSRLTGSSSELVWSMLTLASDEELWCGLQDGCGGRSGGSSTRVVGEEPASVPDAPLDHIARINAEARYRLCRKEMSITVKLIRVFKW